MGQKLKSRRFPLKYVTQKTGLSDQVIRAWENRYKAVVPDRLPNKRRVYSEQEIQKLYLLKQVTRSGHSISQVAHLSCKELQKLCNEIHKNHFPAVSEALNTSAVFKTALHNIQQMDPIQFEETLTNATLHFSPLEMIDHLIVPLMQEIGHRWESGDFTISQEHMASAIVRFLLQSMSKAYRAKPNARRIVIATPSEHHHELGALVISTIAASLGWHVIYLGANTPIAEIANTALNSQANAVALSLTYPTEYEINKKIIHEMRRFLPLEIPLYVGGRAIELNKNIYSDFHIDEIHDSQQFKKALWQLQNEEKA